jgi:hypothetical protein
MGTGTCPDMVEVTYPYPNLDSVCSAGTNLQFGDQQASESLVFNSPVMELLGQAGFSPFSCHKGFKS